MKILILEKGGYRYAQSHYRGTARPSPYHGDNFPEVHELNQAFRWHIDEGGESGIVQNLSKAMSLVDTYRRYGVQPDLEVVEVTDAGETPEVGKILLGYDLSAGYHNSLISGFSAPVSTSVGQGAIDRLAALVYLEVNRHLNGVGLFPNQEVAARCLDYFQAVREIEPNYYEIGNYKVVGLYLLP